jgi:rubrerythrin
MFMDFGVANMEDFTKIIFQNAVIKEQIAKQMYIKLSEKAESDTLKNLFLRLAEEEQIHEELFSKMSIPIVQKVNEYPLKNLNLLSNQKEFSEEILKEINSALDHAITEEQKAYEDYNILLNHLDFGESREALKQVAQQELEHRTRLQKVKLELNKDDWSHIKVPDE